MAQLPPASPLRLNRPLPIVVRSDQGRDGQIDEALQFFETWDRCFDLKNYFDKKFKKLFHQEIGCFFVRNTYC
jgi:hypothetical protein